MRGPVGSLLVLGCLLTGCTTQPGIPQGLRDSVEVAGGVCGLLAVEEVEVALERPFPIGSATSKATDDIRPVLPGMQMCAVGSSSIGVAWGLLTASGNDDAADLFHRYVRWNADYVKTVKVTHAEAVWDVRLGTLVAVRDNRVVAVRMTGSDEDPGAGSARDGARDLAARALRRL